MLFKLLIRLWELINKIEKILPSIGKGYISERGDRHIAMINDISAVSAETIQFIKSGEFSLQNGASSDWVDVFNTLMKILVEINQIKYQADLSFERSDFEEILMQLRKIEAHIIDSTKKRSKRSSKGV
jgi:hypothetical protein